MKTNRKQTGVKANRKQTGVELTASKPEWN